MKSFNYVKKRVAKLFRAEEEALRDKTLCLTHIFKNLVLKYLIEKLIDADHEQFVYHKMIELHHDLLSLEVVWNGEW